MIKRMGMVFAAAVLVLSLGLTARAAETSGSIRISMNTGELPVTNGAVTLYAVGKPVTEGYRIGEDFGGGIVRQGDAMSPQLARWLAEMAESGGTRMLLDADGNAAFLEVEAGLYLVMQTERTDGFYPVEPFLLTVPLGQRWHLQVNPEPEPIVTDLILTENPATGEGPLLHLSILGMLLSGLGLCWCAAEARKRKS